MEMLENELIAFISFKLGGKEYAIEAEHIQEIIEVPEYTPVPKGLDYMLGVFNLKGKVIPLMDMKMKFDLEKRNLTNTDMVLVLKYKVRQRMVFVGIVVDVVNEVFDESIQHFSKDEVESDEECFISGIFKNNHRSIYLVNMEAIFQVDDEISSTI